MEIQMQAAKRYLGIPVKTAGLEEQDLRTLEVFLSDKKIMEFRVPLYGGKPEKADYYAYINMESCAGKMLCLRGDLPGGFFSSVIQSDEDDNGPLVRPELHFTARRGWINDPNGLVCHQGTYELYYQYNPMNTEWENMSWGHGTSRDLIHWDYCDAVLYPDEHGTMYSGCGIPNDRGLLGLPRDALLFFYTAAGDKNRWSEGKTCTQRLAYSLDGGKTFIKHPGWSMAHIAGENRDPKVFYHGETGNYVMVLYLEENDFAVFTSADLENWEETQRLTLPEAWECPDLMLLPADDGTEHWVFWSADGFYFLGDFDGRVFAVKSRRRETYGTKLPYAAQTYSGMEGRTVSVAWLRTRHEGHLYTGAMAIPRELSLVYTGRAGEPKTPDSYRMRFSPVRELAGVWEPFTTCPSADGCAVWQAEGRPYCLKIGWDDVSDGENCRLTLGEESWTIDRKAGTIAHGEDCYAVSGQQPIAEMTVIADRGIVEITANYDIIYLVYETTDYHLTKTVCLEGAKAGMEAASENRDGRQ